MICARHSRVVDLKKFLKPASISKKTLKWNHFQQDSIGLKLRSIMNKMPKIMCNKLKLRLDSKNILRFQWMPQVNLRKPIRFIKNKKALASRGMHT